MTKGFIMGYMKKPAIVAAASLLALTACNDPSQYPGTDGDRTRQREGWPAGEQPPESRTIAGALRRNRNGEEHRNGHTHSEPGPANAEQAPGQASNDRFRQPR